MRKSLPVMIRNRAQVRGDRGATRWGLTRRRSITDYETVIAQAVEGLDQNTSRARHALYERPRTAQVNFAPSLPSTVTRFHGRKRKAHENNALLRLARARAELQGAKQGGIDPVSYADPGRNYGLGPMCGADNGASSTRCGQTFRLSLTRSFKSLRSDFRSLWTCLALARTPGLRPTPGWRP
jgi:hypothetical protein